MWAAVALSTALTLAPAENLELKNVRFTYSALGQERKDAQVLPGDQLVMGYDIDGLTVKEDGKVQWSTALEVLDKDGKSQFTQKPDDFQSVNTLGGSKVPAWSLLSIGTDLPAGQYVFKVTVTDRANKDHTAPAERKFEVVAAKFGMVHLGLYDADSRAPSPPFGVPGQTKVLAFTLTGFETKAGKTKGSLEGQLAVSVQILDEADKPVLAKPISVDIKDIPEDAKSFLPLQFPLNLNRAGKFKVKIKAEDKTGNKTAEQALDLTVVEPK
jgi:hypothetical protein